MITALIQKISKAKEELTSSFYFCTDERLDKSLEEEYNIIIDEQLADENTYVYKITILT